MERDFWIDFMRKYAAEKPGRRDITEQQPERFKRAVQAACCEACSWPECGCTTTAELARKAINEWSHTPAEVATAMKDQR